MINEWKNFRFILTEDLNNMMIELLITNQMLEENKLSKNDKKLLEEHKNKLLLKFRDEFRKHNVEQLKIYNELVNK
ncbi:MAG: hypothetical protein E7166_04495 [Firmicutes bacterium]|nr:hypothetical protein [Bacillota bacterium]